MPRIYRLLEAIGREETEQALRALNITAVATQGTADDIRNVEKQLSEAPHDDAV